MTTKSNSIIQDVVERFPLPLYYRQDTTRFIMERVLAGESCAVVGVSGTGKSHFLSFLAREDVQKKYLGSEVAKYFFILIDLNNLFSNGETPTEWGVYELCLRRISERLEEMSGALERMGAPPQFATRWRRSWDRVAGLGPDHVVSAHGYFERAIHNMCRILGLRPVLIFDEFDAVFQTLNPWFFRRLRAIRDRFRYQVSYIVGIRDDLQRIRGKTQELEAFVEMFSGNTCGLGPYDDESLKFDITRLAKRLSEPRGLMLSEEVLMNIADIAGRHPGLMRASILSLDNSQELSPGSLQNKLAQAPGVQNECEKIWNSIQTDEREMLIDIASGLSLSQIDPNIARILKLKGLVIAEGDDIRIFCDLFQSFVERQHISRGEQIRVDENLSMIWVRDQPVEGLTPLEFNLLAYLYKFKNRICSRSELLAALYPDEKNEPQLAIDDYRLPSLLAHLRKKIEVDPAKPRLIITVWGKGVKLATGIMTEPSKE